MLPQSPLKVKLGCPDYCEGWDCVDLRGNPPREVMDYLLNANEHSIMEIETKNLLEHLTDPGRFLALCRRALMREGNMTLITDNAEFLPFYLPFWIRHSGIGAHSMNQYAIDHCNSIHYMIFTKMHLINLFKSVGFTNVRVTRVKFGARLKVDASWTLSHF